jgi:hypothetical protein
MRNERERGPTTDRWQEFRRGLGEQTQTADETDEPEQNAKQPVAYPAGTILTTAQVAEWLQVSTRHVELMRLPRLKGLGRSARYEAGMVLECLMGKWERVDLLP